MAREKFEVVISGVGGMFPECNSFDDFRELLFSGKSGVTVDTRRWPQGSLDAPPGSGKIPSFDHLDSTFFGMTPNLTEVTDPLTRLCLEKSIEAIVDAGVNPADLSGTHTSVLVGSCISESEFIQLFSSKKLAILGTNRAMQANRISFSLNLTGQSYQLDTTWAGGMQCLDIAKRIVEEGSVDGCIVCVANLTISAAISKQMQGLGVLSKDEYTRSFSSDAGGYNRSEAIVSFYVQRKENARRSYGSIVEVGLKTFGDRDAIFAQNHSPQELKSLLEEVYENVDKSQIGFVEADGSGVRAIDAMELNVLKEVLVDSSKQTGNPLLVGSVKSNVGHTEASSTFVSVSKALVSMDSGLIPPNLSYTEPNPNADALINGDIKVVTQVTPLPAPLVGVTTMGLGSSFGHVVLKQHDKVKAHVYGKYEMYRDGLPRLITVSGRTEQGLRDILKKIKTYVADEEFAALFHQVFKTSIPRHNIRGYVLTPDLSPEDETENLEQVEYYEGLKKPIWFIFSGMGSQWNGMGNDLLRIPMFRASMERLAAVLAPKGVDLFEILTSPDPALFDNILNSFVGIAACQIGLVDILFALGITPDGIVGHSVGELGCAYADGCFTAEQMILAAHARGRASIETDTIDGKMAAIGLGYNQMKDMLADYPSIEIACHNAADSCTLSGPTADVEAVVAKLVADGVFARAVNVANIAYHSRYIAPAAPKLLEYLKEVIPDPKARSSKWVSSSILEEAWDSPLAQTSSPEYHTNNLLSSVYFEEASAHIPQNAICIEIAPHGLLQAILKRSLVAKEVINVPLTLRSVPDGVKFLFQSLGKLYLHGLELNLTPLYPEIEFPVSRGTKPLGQFLDWEHGTPYPLKDMNLQTVFKFEREIWVSIMDHILFSSQLLHGVHVLPAASLMLTAFESLSILRGLEPFSEPVVLQKVRFVRSVQMPTKRAIKIYTMICKGSGTFEMLLGNDSDDFETTDPFMTGSVNFMSQVMHFVDYKFNNLLADVILFQGNPVESAMGDEVYAYLKHFSLTQDPKCQAIKQVDTYKDNMVHAVIDFVANDWLLFLDNIIKVLSYIYVETKREIHVPYWIDSVLVDKQLFNYSLKDKHTTLVDVYYDLDSKIVQCPGLHIFGIRMKPVDDIALPNTVLDVKHLTFVPYQNPTAVTSPSQYSIVCLQLLLENIPPVDKGFKIALNLLTVDDVNNNAPTGSVKPNAALVEMIELLKLQANIEHRVIHYNQTKNNGLIDEHGKIASDTQCYTLVLCQDSASINEALMILGINPHSYLLVKMLKFEQLNLDPSLAVVSSVILDGNKYMFIKNNSENRGASSVVYAMNLNSVGESNAATLKYDLKPKIEEALQSNSNVLIILDSLPSCNVNQFIKQTFLQDDYLFKFFTLFKFFFILDRKAPLFSVTGKFYQEQVTKQLRVNIYKDGVWGSEKFLHREQYQIETFAYDHGFQYNSSSLLKDKVTNVNNQVDIKYLCISNRHMIVDGNSQEDRKYLELGPLEFAGTSPSGTKVIGITPFNKGVSKIQQDPILSWTLPDHWSLEDGVTVPLPYCLAYYILDPRFFGEAKANPYILLSTGLNATGLAFLNLLIDRRDQHKKVFMCVKNKKHRDYLIREYGQYIDEGYLQVLIYTGNRFDIDVKFATQGAGLDLIVNALSGSHFRSAINCTGFRSRMVNLNRKVGLDGTLIGLSMFLPSVELSTFGSDDLLGLSEEAKAEIVSAVTAGIASGVVKPIPSRVMTGPHTGVKALEKLNGSTEGDSFERIVLSLERERPKSLLPEPSVNVKYMFEPDKSYLIVGGKAGTWLDLAEFLLLRGARHILVTVDRNSLSCGALASRKLNLLLGRYPTCDIQMTGPTALDTEQGVLGRLKSCGDRELSAVFLLNMESESKLKNLHAVLQSEVYRCTLYISIYSNDSTLCDVRKANGYPTVCVQSESEDKKLDKVYEILDTLLYSVHGKQAQNESTATVLVDEINTDTQDNDFILLQNIKSHLPENLDELEELHAQLPSAPCWEEMLTRSPRKQWARGSYPIFLVPGLRPHTKLLKQFVQQLYHPCFVAKYPATSDSLVETAKQLIKELDQFNIRTFNLIADSWGGLLALHMAKQLTQAGLYVRLNLLDAAPATIRSWVGYFHDNLEIKLLSKYFPISSKDKQELSPLSWEDKLSHVLPRTPLYSSYASALTCLVSRLRMSWSSILNTAQDTELMPHVKILLLRPEGASESDSCKLERICSGLIEVFVTSSSSSYVDFLRDASTAQQVGDNFLYDYPESEAPLYFVREINATYECKLVNDSMAGL
uniref:Fatty acid synthase n=1 Tax=Cacopsylla melanoneura TaxID=428564 RepID=A0A8D9DYQ6_9HEMI